MESMHDDPEPEAAPEPPAAQAAAAPEAAAAADEGDGLSPAMRMCYAFSARASAGTGATDPLAGSGARSLADMERLLQKQKEETERLKLKAKRIRAEGAKRDAA